MSMRIVGDTGTVAASGQWLNRGIAGLLLLLVTLVGYAAVRSVFDSQQSGSSSEEAAPDTELELDPDSPDRAYPGQQFVIDDLEFPITLACLRAVGSTEAFVVAITNDGNIEADYLVAAELLTDQGQTVEAVAELIDVRPSERREEVLVPEDSVTAIDECTITAVQGDRRVLLTR